MLIELLDQLVRHRSGGEMLSLWSKDVVPAEDFVAQRVGVEYRRIRPQCRGRILPVDMPSARAVGNFRLGGEVHQWMYDSFSLGKLLTESGFMDARSCAADFSEIPDFCRFHLDTDPDGTVYKPDSFFIEAKRAYSLLP